MIAGAVSSVGLEYMLDMHGVAGSNPVPPIIGRCLVSQASASFLWIAVGM